jgi:hypothetical protein
MTMNYQPWPWHQLAEEARYQASAACVCGGVRSPPLLMCSNPMVYSLGQRCRRVGIERNGRLAGTGGC